MEKKTHFSHDEVLTEQIKQLKKIRDLSTETINRLQEELTDVKILNETNKAALKYQAAVIKKLQEENKALRSIKHD